MGALSIVKVLSNDLLEIPAENHAAASFSAPSLQGSLPPEVRLVFASLGFTSLLLKLFPKKPLSNHITKSLLIFTQKPVTVVGCHVQHLSPLLLFSSSFGLPSPSPAQPRAGRMEGCNCQLPPSHPLVQLQLASAGFSL